MYRKTTLIMMKTILFFILFATSFMGQAQDSEYGILFFSDIYPRTEQVQTIGHYTISFSGLSFKLFPNSSYTPQTSEDFFYFSPDPVSKKIDFSFSSFHIDCEIYEEKSMDLNVGESGVGFIGCYANSAGMLIHLPQPGPDNSRCIEDVIDLSSGFNWEYRYDDTNWIGFPSEFQSRTSISFKIKDLLGYDGKSKIDFRTGYEDKFTKFITYNIIPCSPEVAGTIPVLTSCAYTSDGAVTVNLARDLFKGEKLVNMSLKNKDSVPILILLKEINASQFSLSNLEKGSYKFKYQTRMLINGKEANSTPVETTFSIASPSPLKFNLSYSDPKCYTDKGDITITATGGTPPYFYMFGKPDANQVMQYDENTKVQFDPLDNADMSVKIDTLPAGNYTIKVIDKKTCQEQK
jgi:hypothetical protein